MNTTLPPSRDLPPGRHTEIRAAVLTEVAGKPARRWLAPMVTAAAALVAIGMIAWFAPWSSGGGVDAASPPSETTAQPTNETATATQAPPDDEVAIEGVTPEETSAIEQGCEASFQPGVTLTLRQILTDEAGRIALLHGTGSDPGAGGGTYEYLIDCTLDGPAMPYNPAGGGVGEFTPPVSIDSFGGSAGGDVSGGKAIYAGQHGTQVVMGRISTEVAKVTVTVGDKTVEAVLGGDAYLARIVHPTDWVIPENQPSVVVRAYDKNGTLLGEVGP
jgi:hypothetical protein